jgi:hypothetical protein
MGRLYLCGLGYSPVAGFYERGNEPSGSIKRVVGVIDMLDYYQVFKEVYASWS